MGAIAERNKRARMMKRLSPPTASEMRYVHALGGAMQRLHDSALSWLRPKLHLVAQKKDSTRFDASALSGDFDRKVNDLAVDLATSVAPAFNALAGDLAKNNARALKSIGLDVRDNLGAVIDTIRARNIALIKNAADDFADEVGSVLSDLASWGLTVDELAALIEKRADVSQSRAHLIARDQTSKTNAAINQHRQTTAGISHYEWSTSRDDRVREEHAAHEGEVFAWNNPPSDTGAPGDDINCRCVSVPILDSESGDEDE